MKYVLGIDVGGSKIAAGLVDKAGRVSQTAIVPTSQADLVKQLIRLIESYDNFDEIGLGVPGTVLPNGMIRRFPNIRNFKAANLKKYLEKRFQVPVSVMNDAEAFTLAESKLGKKKFKKVFGVILGTGIGAGLVTKNIHQDTGAFLHRVIPGLEAKMQKFGWFHKPEDAAPFIKKLLPVIIENFSPDLIVFGGSRSSLPGMQRILEATLNTTADKKVAIKVSKLKHAGIIGAVLPLLKK